MARTTVTRWPTQVKQLYSAWVGVLNAADYGVPQARQRVVLMTSLSGRRCRLPQLMPASRGRASRAQRHCSGPPWPTRRTAAPNGPATTVQGDRHIGRPGHKDRAGGEGQFDRDAVTLTLDELAALQDFPPGYRFAGTDSSIARQIGNAVPVGLAAAVVHALAGSSEEGRSGSDLAPGEQGLIAGLVALSREDLDWPKEH